MAVRFHGTDKYLKRTTSLMNPYTGQTRLTIMFWVRLNEDPDGSRTFYYLADTNDSWDSGIWTGTDTSGTGVYASVWASGGSPSWDSTHYNLEIGRWTHIALTRLTTTWKFYVDGEQIGSHGTFTVPSARTTPPTFSLFMHIPGLRVVTPVFPADAKGLLKTALRSDDPVMFLEHKKLMKIKGDVPEGEYFTPFGKANIVRPGKDVTVVAISFMVIKSLEAAGILEKEGVPVGVIDPRTLSPLDIDTILESISRTHRLLVVDEDYSPCGAGAEITAQVMERGFYELDAPVRRVNGAFAPAPYSPPLEAAVVPNEITIAQALRDLLVE